MPKKPAKLDVAQSDRFIEAARAAGASEDEAVFDANLKGIVRVKIEEDVRNPAANVGKKRKTSAILARRKNENL